jgi:hypothetical protein
MGVVRAFGAAAMSFSSVSVIANALRPPQGEALAQSLSGSYDAKNIAI